MTCDKVSFGSAHAARRANRHARFRLHCYWCDTCNAWHASNSDKNPGDGWGRDPLIDREKKRQRRWRVAK